MRPQVATVTGCLMLGGLMLIPLAGVLRVSARNWQRQPIFSSTHASGTSGSRAVSQVDAASVTLARRADQPSASPGGPSRAAITRQTTADDYALYWRTADYAYPDVQPLVFQPPHHLTSPAAVSEATGIDALRRSRGTTPLSTLDPRDGAFVLQGSALRVTDPQSDEAIRLGASLITGSLGTGLNTERVGSWLYFGPFNQASTAAGASELSALSAAADFSDFDGGAIRPVTPTMTSSSPTSSRSLDNVVIASVDRPPGRGASNSTSPTPFDPSTPYGPAAPSDSGAPSSPPRNAIQAPSTPPAAGGDIDSPAVQRPSANASGAGGNSQSGRPTISPAPLPAPFPLPPPGDSQPPGAPPSSPVFGDTGDIPPYNPSAPDPVNPPPAFPPAAPPANPPKSDPNPPPPAQPPVFPDFVPPLGEAITSSDGALPDLPPSLPAFDNGGPGNANPPPELPGFDPPAGPGDAGFPGTILDEEFASGWMPADYGFSAAPEPGCLILLVAGLCCSALRLPRSK